MRVGSVHRGAASRDARAALLLLGLLVGSGAASAGPGHAVKADLLVTGPVVLDGTLEVSSNDATVVLVPPEDDSPVASFDAAQATLRVVTSRRDVVVAPNGAEVWLRPDYDIQTLALERLRATVHGAGDDFVGLVTPLGGARLGVDLAPARRELGVDREPKDYAIGSTGQQPYNFDHEVPAGSFQLFCEGEPAVVLADGAMQLAVTGVILDVETTDGLRTFELGDRMEPAEATGTTSPLYRKVTSFAILALEGARARVGDAAGAVFYSQEPSLQLEGRLVVERASGVLAAPGAAAQARDDRLVFDGRFSLQGVRSAGSDELLGQSEEETRLRVEGTASQVLIGGRPWALPPDAADAVAPAAALLAVLVAWLTGLGPKVLAAAAAPAFAAATPEGILANERRRAIYQAVLREPGIHMRELHRLTGMRWGSLQYHTAVLVGTGLLVATRAGRRTVLACDAHHLSPEQVKALHLLRSPRALRVARAVASGQAATQRDIAVATGVSFRLVSRYLGVMQNLGLVETRNGSRPKRYASTPRLAELLPHAVRDPGAAGWPPAGH